jgi:hypothetical protein
MKRTKWLRLGVRDAADILRWAGEQDVRRLDDYRYRMIGGREFISFRMVPRYAIQIGTSDIVVVAHVRGGARHLVAAVFGRVRRRLTRGIDATLAALKPRELAPAAELYHLPMPRRSAPSHR